METRHKVALGIAASAALALALPYDRILEGLELSPYFDPVPIESVCYGETHVAMKKYTAQQCEDLLEKSQMAEIIFVQNSTPTKLNSHQLAAFALFTRNVGEGNLKSSTLLKKLNAGDIVGACNQLSKWVYAGGKVLPGLVKRREAERNLCLEK